MKVQPRILKELVQQYNHELETLKAKYRQMRLAYESCESPLEQEFLDHFLWSKDRYPLSHINFHEDGHIIIQQFLPVGPIPCHLVITPQHTITLHPGHTYRVDFFMDAGYYDDDTESAVSVVRYAIEIDGHDFHERTKAQAQRDRFRDRVMTAAGITVFRFTGSEVHRSAEEVTAELQRTLFKLTWERARDYFERNKEKFLIKT